MKKLIIVFIFLLLNLNAEVIKNTNTKTMAGSGSGVTREEAINNAIIEALGKLQGVKVNSSKFISTKAVANNGQSDIKDTYSSEINRVTNGRVDGFSVDNISQFDGMFQADVTIKKVYSSKQYKTPGLDPNNRRKMAVLPVFSDRDYFLVFEGKIAKEELTRPLTQDILNAMTNTRKFTILDRVSNPGVYALEEAVVSSKQAANDEALKLGNVLGADYILITNISDFDISKNTSNLTGKTQNKITTRIEYRVLMMATRQVKFSGTKNFSINASGNSLGEIISKATNKIANEISFEIIDVIYPLKVADVVNNEVIISQSLNIGEIYDVFSQGKKIADSYTKESVGSIENKTASIEIIRSSSKMSYAKILEGSVKKGDICRKKDSGINSNIGKNSSVKIKENGGVVLPF